MYQVLLPRSITARRQKRPLTGRRSQELEAHRIGGSFFVPLLGPKRSGTYCNFSHPAEPSTALLAGAALRQKNTIPPSSPHPQAVGTPGKKRRRACMTSGLARHDVL